MQVIGEDADFEKSGSMLNRVIEWDRHNITIEADQRTHQSAGIGDVARGEDRMHPGRDSNKQQGTH